MLSDYCPMHCVQSYRCCMHGYQCTSIHSIAVIPSFPTPFQSFDSKSLIIPPIELVIECPLLRHYNTITCTLPQKPTLRPKQAASALYTNSFQRRPRSHQYPPSLTVGKLKFQQFLPSIFEIWRIYVLYFKKKKNTSKNVCPFMKQFCEFELTVIFFTLPFPWKPLVDLEARGKQEVSGNKLIKVFHLKMSKQWHEHKAIGTKQPQAHLRVIEK